MAIFNPSKKTLTYEGGSFSLALSLGTGETEATSWGIEYLESDKTYSVSITATGATYCEMTVIANYNFSTVQRNHTFYVVKKNSNLINARYRYSFTVGYDYSRVIKPIWQDIECYGDGTVMEYQIVDVATDEVLYRGKSIAEPDGGNAGINVNKICSNYLSNSLEDGIKNSQRYNYNYVKWFKIQQANNSVAGWKDIGQFRFYNSYAYGDEPTTVFNIDPIRRTLKKNGVMGITIDRRQYTPISAFNKKSTEKTLVCRYVNGGTIREHYTAVLDNTAELIDFRRDIYYDSNVDALQYMTNSSDDGSVYVDIKDSCYDYCLYYCNAYGGWDSLLIGGNAVKTDKIDSKYFNSHFNNTTQDFEKRKYANVITTEYKLYTDWFNDDEQSRLHHLLESTQVYLHNLNTDEIYPVNLTNTECVYKTFTNNGKKKWYNTFNATVAQTKIRR